MSRELFVRFNTFVQQISLVSCLSFFAVTIMSSNVFAQDGQNNTPIKIVVLGDSLSAGYGLNPGEAFPEKLQKALAKKYPNLTIENAGVSGDTSSGGLARLNWSVPQDTNGVIIELGANDALRGISPKLTAENLAKMIEQLKERGVKVLLTGMLAPPNMGDDYAKEFNPLYKNLAEEKMLMFYPFFLEGVAGEASLNQADGIHPTSKGIDIIVDKISPTVEMFISYLRS